MHMSTSVQYITNAAHTNLVADLFGGKADGSIGGYEKNDPQSDNQKVCTDIALGLTISA
jgi:hypothetical protein